MWGRRRGVNLVDTPEMDAFFERLDHLSREQLLALDAAWHSTTRREHEQAWAAVRAAGDRAGLGAEIGRIRNKAMAWSTRGSNSVPYYRVNDDEAWLQVKMGAGEAIVDAALAVALGSRLDPATRDTLLGPWLRATEAQG
jgi:hypothetical protein